MEINCGAYNTWITHNKTKHQNRQYVTTPTHGLASGLTKLTMDSPISIKKNQVLFSSSSHHNSVCTRKRARLEHGGKNRINCLRFFVECKKSDTILFHISNSKHVSPAEGCYALFRFVVPYSRRIWPIVDTRKWSFFYTHIRMQKYYYFLVKHECLVDTNSGLLDFLFCNSSTSNHTNWCKIRAIALILGRLSVSNNAMWWKWLAWVCSQWSGNHFRGTGE